MLHAAVSLSSHGHCPCSMQIGFVRCYCMALPLIAIGQVEKCWDPIGWNWNLLAFLLQILNSLIKSSVYYPHCSCLATSSLARNIQIQLNNCLQQPIKTLNCKNWPIWIEVNLHLSSTCIISKHKYLQFFIPICKVLFVNLPIGHKSFQFSLFNGIHSMIDSLINKNER